MKKSELKQLIKEVLSEEIDSTDKDLLSLVGKVVRTASYNRSLGDYFDIEFTDGSSLHIYSPEKAAGVDYGFYNKPPHIRKNSSSDEMKPGDMNLNPSAKRRMLNPK